MKNINIKGIELNNESQLNELESLKQMIKLKTKRISESKNLYCVVLCGNKKKSRVLYYKMIGYKGVEFTPNIVEAHIVKANSIEDQTFLLEYIVERIKEVGLYIHTNNYIININKGNTI